MPFYSKTLNRIFPDNDFDQEIDLAEFIQPVSQAFGNEANKACALFASATGRMKIGTLVRHLADLTRCDSAVRDMHTTGHLAKLLARYDVLSRTSNYYIIGMPNTLFDRLSQQERTEFFKKGGSMELDPEAFASPETRAMVTREAEILGEKPWIDHESD